MDSGGRVALPGQQRSLHFLRWGPTGHFMPDVAPHTALPSGLQSTEVWPRVHKHIIPCVVGVPGSLSWEPSPPSQGSGLLTPASTPSPVFSTWILLLCPGQCREVRGGRLVVKSLQGCWTSVLMLRGQDNRKGELLNGGCL